MIPFLRSVATEIVSRYGGALRDICFVLPGKRAALFLDKYLREAMRLRGGRLSRRDRPVMMTLAEFTEKLAGKRTGSSLELLFTLFKAWKEVTSREADFERFRTWADTVLSDFNEIDMHGVNADDIFRNIADHNEISTDYLNDEQRRVIAEYFGVSRFPSEPEKMWTHFNTGSETQQRYLELWGLLRPLYHAFADKLAAEEFSYSGDLCLRACATLETRGADALPAPRIVVAGLDMLAASQMRLLELLRDMPRTAPDAPSAIFFWDAPGTPLAAGSPVDAGKFQHLNMERFPCAVPGMERYSASLSFPPVLDVVACPGATAQAKVAGMLLDKIVSDGGKEYADPARVAVVLPEENLLFPVYYALPPGIASGVNVTMGYPVHLTSPASFVVLLRRLQQAARRDSSGRTLFHNKEVRALLSHPFMQLLLGVREVEKMQGVILARHLFYVSQEMLAGAADSECRPGVEKVLGTVMQTMKPEDDFRSACEWVRDCLTLVLRKYVAEMPAKRMTPPLEITHLLAYIDTVNDFETLAARHAPEGMKWRTALSLLDRMLRSHTIHLQGQPLTGVQIMGMLETRALDFDYLIIPSMNERIFPPRMRTHTFIPDTIRRAWLLPTAAVKEQTYAYHFYRLIARAKEVHMLYDASQSGLKSGDPSRYLQQLKYLFGDAPRLRWRSARFGIASSPMPSFSVVKREEGLLPFLTPGSKRNLSASSLKDYLECPFRFYLSHVLCKKPVGEPEEFMDAKTQGTILHDSMQHIYDSLIPPGYPKNMKPPRRPITSGIIKSWLESESFIRDIVENNVRCHYPAAAHCRELEGDAAIMAEVIATYVRWCLQADLRLAPFTYIDNERKIDMTLPLPSGRRVNMTFIIDRLDMVDTPEGRRLRIVDYKTGSDSLTFSSVPELFHAPPGKNTKGIFQLMLYALLHGALTESTEPVALAIYPTRRLEATDFRTAVECSGKPVYDHKPYLDEFKTRLMEIIEELFDTETPFAQTSDTSKCTYCDFKELCARGTR